MWAGAIVGGLALAIGLFFVVPVALTSLFKEQLGSAFLFWLVEGVLRTAIFLGYLSLLSRMRDLRRVFEYHGAEHKVISCFEAGEPLEPERAQRFSRLHPRCGTSFLLIVMIVAIFVFAPIGLPAWYVLLATRVLGVPLIAGLSFEVIKWAGRNRSKALGADDHVARHAAPAPHHPRARPRPARGRLRGAGGRARRRGSARRVRRGQGGHGGRRLAFRLQFLQMVAGPGADAGQGTTSGGEVERIVSRPRRARARARRRDHAAAAARHPTPPSSQKVTASTRPSRSSCHARYLNGAAGTQSITTTAPDTGLIRARLSGGGDWDLGVFDANSGRYVAGSASFGSSELAEGFVKGGQKLVVQACRFRGSASSADLSVGFVKIAEKSTGKVQLVDVSTTRKDKKRLQSLGLDLTEHGDKDSVEVVLHGQADEKTLATPASPTRSGSPTSRRRRRPTATRTRSSPPPTRRRSCRPAATSTAISPTTTSR